MATSTKSMTAEELSRAFLPLLSEKYGMITELARKHGKTIQVVSKVISGTPKVVNELDYQNIRMDAIREYGCWMRPIRDRHKVN